MTKEEYRDMLLNGKVSDGEFKRLITLTESVLGFSDHALARKLRVSVQTITLWKKGVGPHKYMRSSVYRAVSNLIKEDNNDDESRV